MESSQRLLHPSFQLQSGTSMSISETNFKKTSITMVLTQKYSLGKWTYYTEEYPDGKIKFDIVSELHDKKPAELVLC